MKALQQLSSPLVVPIDDYTGHVSAIGESHPAIPQLAGGRLIVPIENAGLGPAINITAKLTTNSGDRPSVDYAAMRVLAPGRRAALIFGPLESLADFELQLSYEDPTARPHRLTAGWRLEHRSYIAKARHPRRTRVAHGPAVADSPRPCDEIFDQLGAGSSPRS